MSRERLDALHSAPPAPQESPRLSRFIRDNVEAIHAEWETFARSLPEGGTMNVAALRDHAKEMLLVIAAAYPDSVVQVETGGDLSGQWDVDRLTKALTNLVANAVQHGARGKPIRVSASGVADEVTFSVHNEGPPIPAEQQEAIFQKGHRAGGRTAATDRRHQGLGLYIVERIVASHGGSVSVRSSAEGGTTFTIRLPRRPGG